MLRREWKGDDKVIKISPVPRLKGSREYFNFMYDYVTFFMTEKKNLNIFLCRIFTIYIASFFFFSRADFLNRKYVNSFIIFSRSLPLKHDHKNKMNL